MFINLHIVWHWVLCNLPKEHVLCIVLAPLFRMLIYSPPWLFQPLLFSPLTLWYFILGLIVFSVPLVWKRGHNRKVTYSFGQYILNFSSWHCLVSINSNCLIKPRFLGYLYWMKISTLVILHYEF
jgi:hypothetical protein